MSANNVLQVDNQSCTLLEGAVVGSPPPPLCCFGKHLLSLLNLHLTAQV